MLIEKVCLPRYLFRYVTNTLSYLRNVLGVDAVYGVAHVLPGRHQQREGEARHHGDRLQQGDSVVIGDRNICRGPHIVQPEDGGVNLDMRELDEALEAAKEVEHLVRGWRPGLSQGSR